MFDLKNKILRYYVSLDEKEIIFISILGIIITNTPFFIGKYSEIGEFFILLRIISLMLFLTFIFLDFFYADHKIVGGILWISNLFLSMIVIPAIILIFNKDNPLWALNWVLSIFSLCFFLHWRLVLYNLIFVFLCLIINLYYDFFIFPKVILEMLFFSFLTVILVGIPLLRMRENFLFDIKKGYKKIIFSIAHEIRTPLASINLLCETLLKKPLGVEDLHKVALKIKEINTKNIKIIDFLVSFSKDKISFTKKKILISAYLKSFIHENYRNEEKNGLIHIDIQRNGCILIDEYVFFHVINNIVKNSIYHIKKNNNGMIFITLKREGNKMLISLKDTSTGINPDILPLIFDEFFSTKNDGFGIGLHFAKKAVEAMGGRILCHSIENEFTDFNLIFEEVEDAHD